MGNTQTCWKLWPITTHLKSHKFPYYWGFPLCPSVTKEGVQHVLHDPSEGEAFLKVLGLLPLPPEDLLPPPSTSRARQLLLGSGPLPRDQRRRPPLHLNGPVPADIQLDYTLVILQASAAVLAL